MELTACQHRLEHIAGIHGTFGRPSTDQGVQLVDEQNDLPLRLLHLLENGLQTFLKLPAVFGTGNQRAQVQRNDALVTQTLGHIALDDALRQALHNGRLAYAGLANQHRVVFRASR